MEFTRKYAGKSFASPLHLVLLYGPPHVPIIGIHVGDAKRVTGKFSVLVAT